jgi:site-specific DNA recombinase
MPRRTTTSVESLGVAPSRTLQPLSGSDNTDTALAHRAPPSQPSVLRPTARVRAALYARVSTDKQERDETIASQVAALLQASAQRGYQVSDADVFRDEGYSGARLDRPALDRLRDLVAEGGYDVVLVLAPDRLARHYAYQVVVTDEFTQAGCRVEFLNHTGGTSPEEHLLLQMQGVFAEYERALIAERLRRGRLFAARQGRATWAHPPFGYTYLRKTVTAPQTLLINEHEAEIVRLMYHWLVEEGLSSYAITRRLQEQHFSTRKGRGWRQSTVIEVLRDPLYKGVGYFNRTGPTDAHRPHGPRGYKDQRPGNQRGVRWRPQEEWVMVPVPVIIDPALWQAAQDQLAVNRLRSVRNHTAHGYLLRGLVVCGQCGRRMVGSWNKAGGRYVCSVRYPRFAPNHCDGRSIMAPAVEAQVWDYVHQLLAEPEVLYARYADGMADPAYDRDAEQEMERLGRRLAGHDREIQRLLDAYQAEAMTVEELKQRRQQIEVHRANVAERIHQLEQRRDDREDQLRLIQGAELFCASIQQALVDPSFATKQQVLPLVVDRIVVAEDELVVHHIIPTGPFRLQTERIPPRRPSPSAQGRQRPRRATDEGECAVHAAPSRPVPRC